MFDLEQMDGGGIGPVENRGLVGLEKSRRFQRVFLVNLRSNPSKTMSNEERNGRVVDKNKHRRDRDDFRVFEIARREGNAHSVRLRHALLRFQLHHAVEIRDIRSERLALSVVRRINLQLLH